MPKLKDFITAENQLDGSEYAYISQLDKTRKTTYQKIKEWLLGTTALTTTDKTITGAIQELKGKVDTNTTSLSTIMNERGYVNIKRIPNTDLNNLTNSGLYAGNNLTNAPASTPWFVIEVFNCGDSNNYVIQRAMGFADGGTNTYERRNNLGTWTAWKLTSTATKPTEITVTPLNGFATVTGSEAVYSKTQEGLVTLNIFISKTAGQTTACDLFTLPAGYRPSNAVRVIFSYSNSTTMKFGTILVYPTGGVTIEYVDGATTFTDVRFTTSFIAGN